MKLHATIVFYILSVYVVFNARSLFWKKFKHPELKSLDFKTCHCRKNTVKITDRLNPDSSATAPPTASKKPAGTTIRPSNPDSSATAAPTASKKPAGTTIRPSNPDSSATAAPTASKKPAGTTIRPSNPDSSATAAPTASKKPAGTTIGPLTPDSSTPAAPTASKKPAGTTIRPLTADSSTPAAPTASRKPAGTTIRPLTPDSSTPAPPTASKKPAGTTIGPLTPDSSTPDRSIISNTSATTNEPSAAHCFSDADDSRSTNFDLNVMNELILETVLESSLQHCGQQLQNSSSQPSFIFSPYTIYDVITLFYLGMDDQTKSLFRKNYFQNPNVSTIDVLRYRNNSRNVEQQRKKKGNESKAYEYNSATHLWMSKEYPLRECILNLLGNELENIDFSNGLTNVTSEWLNNETKGRSNKFLGKIQISDIEIQISDIDFIIFNSIHFQGHWAFANVNIRNDSFYGATNTNVTFVDFTGNFSYVDSEELGAQILQLPYEGAELSMFILLPSKPYLIDTSKGLGTLLEKLLTDEAASSKLKKYLKGVPSVARCRVSLPQFITSTWSDLDYQPIETGFYDFTHETGVHRGYIINYVMHEAEMKVPATSATSRLNTDFPELVNFTANHPFLFIVCDTTRMKILFTGIYINPELLASSTG